MKTTFTLIINLCFLLSCTNKHNSIEKLKQIDLIEKLNQIDSIEKQKPINYDSLCIIGKRYIIYGYKFDKNNPFDIQPKSDVIIVNKVNNYVQYCWYYDIDKIDKCLFSRSCEEFIKSLNANQ